MAVKKKAKLTPKGKYPIMNFRASPATKVRLRSAAKRLGLTQAELMRRFVAALPVRNSKSTKSVSVSVEA